MADRAVALNPNSYQAWTAEAGSIRLPEPEEAIRSFERSMRVSPVDLHVTPAFTG
jgi:adenylate cyclase